MQQPRTTAGDRRRAAAIVVVLVSLPLSFLGCGAADAGSDQTERSVRSDSAGIEIVENHSPAWRAGEEWTVDPEPDLQIGEVEGTEDEMLHGIVSVRHAGEEILIAQQTELRFYDGVGELTRRLGNAGEGPGEFRRIADAIACGEWVAATELFPSRLTLFESSGSPRTVSLPPPEMQGHLNPLSPLLACSPASVVGSMGSPFALTSEPSGIQRNRGLLLRAHTIDAHLDTLLSYPTDERYEGMVVPFGRRTLVAAGDTLLYVVDTGAAELRVFGMDGQPMRIVRMAMPERAVTEADVERIRSLYLYRDQGGLSPGLEAEILARLDAVPIPRTMPHFSAIRVTPDGSIWLRASQPFRDEEVTRWTVISAFGEWLGEVDLPSGLAVHDIDDDGVLGVWRDEYDVEHVRRHRIRR